MNISEKAKRKPADTMLAKGSSETITAVLYFFTKKKIHEENETSTRTGKEITERKSDITNMLLSEPGASKSMKENAEIQIPGITSNANNAVIIIRVTSALFFGLSLCSSII